MAVLRAVERHDSLAECHASDQMTKGLGSGKPL